MNDTYARYTFTVSLMSGRGLTEKGHGVLQDALDNVMPDALDSIYEKLRAALPTDVDDCIEMHWREEPT